MSSTQRSWTNDLGLNSSGQFQLADSNVLQRRLVQLQRIKSAENKTRGSCLPFTIYICSRSHESMIEDLMRSSRFFFDGFTKKFFCKSQLSQCVSFIHSFKSSLFIANKLCACTKTRLSLRVYHCKNANTKPQGRNELDHSGLVKAERALVSISLLFQNNCNWPGFFISGTWLPSWC